jgi:DNA methyltransferase 1-associated protein 1
MAEFINLSWPNELLIKVQYQYQLKCFQLKASSSHETKIYVFDADHERRRKEQLKRIFERTPEQVLLNIAEYFFELY